MPPLPKLQTLSLYECPVGDASAETLGKMTSLVRLDLGTKLGDAGLAKLAALKNLEDSISDRRTFLTPASCIFPRLPKLSRLSLYGDHVTDAGIADLERLTGLSELQIRGTNITAAGCDRLRRALPKTRVGWVERRTGPARSSTRPLAKLGGKARQGRHLPQSKAVE